MNKHTAISVMCISWGVACIFNPMALMGISILGPITGIVLDE